MVWWTEAYKAPVTLDEADVAHMREHDVDVKTYLYDMWADWSTGPDVKSTSFEIYSIAADDGDPLPSLPAASGQPGIASQVGPTQDGDAPAAGRGDAPPSPSFPSPIDVHGIIRTLADFHQELGDDFEFLSARQRELMVLCQQYTAADHDQKETV